MNKSILKPEVQEFIINFSGDLSKLAFSGSPFHDITTRELLEQIKSRQKAKTKIPTWVNAENIYYPPTLNLEQTSSEITAEYKSKLVHGKQVADITGGFGVDSFLFAKQFEYVDHFEVNPFISEIAKHNLDQLGCKNIQFKAVDGIEGVDDRHYDLIYVDPSRRHDAKGKVFFLEDCLPNIPEHLEYLMERTSALLIKTSPMLDISIGIKALKYVNEIHILAVQNEVKEVLWLLKKPTSLEPRITTVNMTNSNDESFSFKYGDLGVATYSGPLTYLYEPNAAILKSGGFSVISERFGIAKLGKHTHLYTSDELMDFPGRRFRIENIVAYSKKDMRAGITFDKANIAIRNFPESVEALRKRWKIKDGGENFVFFTTAGSNEKMMLLCKKITT
ncbi:MAG: methyltransferase [Flavobacteriaceae bacterium]|nr:methyltransferase [Flavobacteriaceae bacterium]